MMFPWLMLGAAVVCGLVFSFSNYESGRFDWWASGAAVFGALWFLEVL